MSDFVIYMIRVHKSSQNDWFSFWFWVLSGIASLTSHRNLSNLLGGKLSGQFQGRMDPIPIESFVFSSGRHIDEILSVGVPFLGVNR